MKRLVEVPKVHIQTQAAAAGYSAGKAARRQISGFFRGRRATHDGISMRKTSEARDQVGVQFGETQTLRIAAIRNQARVQRDRLRLGGGIFVMGKRQIEELPQ